MESLDELGGSGGSLTLGVGTGAQSLQDTPVNALPAFSSQARLPQRWPRHLGRGEGSRGAASFCPSSASSSASSSCPGGNPRNSTALWVSPWPACIRLPHLSAHSPGLAQASQSRKLIRFPRKDAERDGQIELGVPGIQAQGGRRVPVRPAPPAAAAATRGPGGSPAAPAAATHFTSALAPPSDSQPSPRERGPWISRHSRLLEEIFFFLPFSP